MTANRSDTPTIAADDLREAARTLLALAAEYESRHAMLQVPGDLTWQRAAGAGPDAYATLPEGAAEIRGLGDGVGVVAERRVRRSEGVLRRVTAELLEEANERESEAILDDVSRFEHESGEDVEAALRRARRQEPILDDPNAWLLRGSMDRQPSVPPRNAGAAHDGPSSMDDASRNDVVRYVATLIERRLSFRTLDTWKDDLVARLAAAFDDSTFRDRMDRSAYAEAARCLIRGAMPPGRRHGSTSKTFLATEVGEDPDRATAGTFDAVKNRRRRAVLYALSCLQCGGDIVRAVDEAEPHNNNPKIKL